MSKVALFNQYADKHIQKQAVNPFSNGKVGSLPKPQISKDEYGKYVLSSFTRCIVANGRILHF